MNASTQKRIARLSGLLLMSMLVLVLAASAALAMRDYSTGAGGSTSAASATRPLQVPELSQTQGVSTAAFVAGVNGNDVQVVSDGTSSTTLWIALGAAAAAFIIALFAWTMIRRRRPSSEPASSADCALHPDSSLCGAV